ncbi:MAG: caspase family protein [Deltaproteobacteria bacterium]|nr:caspase family protein [Deltaproteobacteria bacterium]
MFLSLLWVVTSVADAPTFVFAPKRGRTDDAAISAAAEFYAAAGQMNVRARGGALDVWDFRRRLFLRSMHMAHRPNVVTFSPDGQIVAGASDTEVWIFDRAGPLRKRVGDLRVGDRFAVSTSGAKIAWVEQAEGEKSGTLVVALVMDAKERKRVSLSAAGTPHLITFSMDERFVAVAFAAAEGPTRLDVFDLSSGNPTPRVSNKCSSVPASDPIAPLCSLAGAPLPRRMLVDGMQYENCRPHGARWITCVANNQTLVWDRVLGAGSERFTAAVTEAPAVSFNDEGDVLLAVASPRSARLWNVSELRESFAAANFADLQRNRLRDPLRLYPFVGGRFALMLDGFAQSIVDVQKATASFTKTQPQSRPFRKLCMHEDGVHVLAAEWKNGDRFATTLWSYGKEEPAEVTLENGFYKDAHQPCDELWRALSKQSHPELAPKSRLVSAVCVDDRDFCLKPMSGAPLVFVGHTAPVITHSLSKDGRRLLTTSHDATSKLWDVPSQRLLATFVADTLGAWIAYTPEGDYVSEGSADRFMSVRDGERVRPLAELEGARQRPDLVLARIGSRNTALVDAYRLAHERRAMRPMTEAQPTLGRWPDVLTKNASSALTVESPVPLVAVHVRINGISVRRAVKNTTSATVELQLLPGPNAIQIEGETASGAHTASDTLSIELVAPSDRGKPTLHVLAIGVSRYDDPALALDYAAKDAADLAEALGDSTKFSAVRKKTLLDGAVTREAIASSAAFFANAGPGDAVVVFLAGHGFVTATGRYYYATHDVSIDRPEERGFALQELSELFAKTNARHRLLLLDTCHSGGQPSSVKANARLVTDDYRFPTHAAPATTLTRGMRSKTIGTSTRESLRATRHVTLATLQVELGATVLSSSGGDELSFESSEFKNGFFTKAVLDALKNPGATEEGGVNVRTLADYVTERVGAMSEGRQNPTLRAAHPWSSFVLSVPRQ